MVMNTDSRGGDKGLSTRHLILFFLAGVAVCGVFFSLGFLVGYNERATGMSPAIERVPTSGAIPPTVNPPLETVPIGSNSGTPSSSSSRQKAETTARVEPPPASPPALSAKPGPEPDTTATPPAEPRTAGGAFIVQVTAMRTRQEAESVVRVLRGRGYHALLVPPQHAHAKDSLYRVQVGPFAARDSAEKTLAKLKHEGFKPFIHR
jgi:cell division septation protein DedD